MVNGERKEEELSVQEAAEAAGTTQANIYHAIYRQKIEARAIPTRGARGEWRINRRSFDLWRQNYGKKRRKQSDHWGRPGQIVTQA